MIPRLFVCLLLLSAGSTLSQSPIKDKHPDYVAFAKEHGGYITTITDANGKTWSVPVDPPASPDTQVRGVPPGLIAEPIRVPKGLTLIEDPAVDLAEEARMQVLEAQLAAEAAKKEKRATEIRIAGELAGVFLVAAGLWLAIRYRERWVPRTIRGKQSLVLLPVALWCGWCCLREALSVVEMRHPVNAVATAVLLSMPAILLGAVVLWWISNPVAGREDRLDTETSQ